LIGSALQTDISAKHDEIGSLKANISIDSVTNLQAVLDSKSIGISLSALAGDGVSIIQDPTVVRKKLQGFDGIAVELDATTDQIRVTRSAIQPLITTDSLAISDVALLQSSLDGKQALITTGDLAINDVALLQSSLDAKQLLVTTESLAISDVASLQSSSDAKQKIVTTDSLAISDMALLQASLHAKQSLLANLDGTGITLLHSASQLRRIVGSDGISIISQFNVADDADPTNFQIQVSGLDLSDAIALKRDALTNLSAVSIDSLTATSGITTSSILAPSGSSLLLGNSNGTGVTVTDSGGVGILKTFSEALDVFGMAACTDLRVADSITALTLKAPSNSSLTLGEALRR
jgi:hypothetical protein